MTPAPLGACVRMAGTGVGRVSGRRLGPAQVAIRLACASVPSASQSTQPERRRASYAAAIANEARWGASGKSGRPDDSHACASSPVIRAQPTVLAQLSIRPYSLIPPTRQTFDQQSQLLPIGLSLLSLHFYTDSFPISFRHRRSALARSVNGRTHMDNPPGALSPSRGIAMRYRG